jgi:hypothetical protein
MGVIETRRVRRQAGGRAERHYRELRKQWRRDHRKVFLIFGLMTLAMFIAMLTLAALMPRYTFLAGVGAGAFFGALVVFRDTPPSWIERHREGAQGEQLTAREIVKLLPRGWVVLSDLHRDKANIDHVLIGPAGVFVLDSKNLNGTVETSRPAAPNPRRSGPTRLHNRSMGLEGPWSSVARQRTAARATSLPDLGFRSGGSLGEVPAAARRGQQDAIRARASSDRLAPGTTSEVKRGAS